MTMSVCQLPVAGGLGASFTSTLLPPHACLSLLENEAMCLSHRAMWGNLDALLRTLKWPLMPCGVVWSVV